MRRLLLIGLAVLAGSAYLLAGTDADHTLVFTAEQAAAGKIEIQKNSFGACTDCHATGLTRRAGDPRELPPLASLSDDYQKLIKGNGGIVPPFVGADFVAKWGRRTTQDLLKEFDDRFRSLTLDTRLNLIAYILQRNGAKAGPSPLTAETDVTIADLLVQAQQPRFTVITGATLIGLARPAIRDAVLVIDGSRIAQVGARGAVRVPADAVVVDAQGKYVIPGLADMHHHLSSGAFGPNNPRLTLRRMLAVGVTTIFDPSIPLQDFTALKTAAADDASPLARFFSTGPIVTVKGDDFGANVNGPTPETPAEATAAVRDLKAAGVDAIKIQRDDLSWALKPARSIMKEDVLRAIVDEAHRDGLKVFVHAPLLRFAKEALRAGVDGLMHGIVDEPLDKDFVTLMKRNRAVYVSTMALYEDVGDVAAWARREGVNWDKANLQPPRLYEQFTNPAGVAQFTTFINNGEYTKQRLPLQRTNLKRAFDAGIPIVLGTDTGFFGVLVGAATQIELELLIEAGLKPEDALRAATVNAAKMIGREKDFGTLEAGKAADLVILDADPRVDIKNVTRINRTYKGGVAYDPVDPARPLRGRGPR